MADREEPARVRAIIDWEVAAPGDALRDLGWFLATYAVPGEALHHLTQQSTASLQNGWPTREQLAERYGVDPGVAAWYTAGALFGLAVRFALLGQRPDEFLAAAYAARDRV